MIVPGRVYDLRDVGVNALAGQEISFFGMAVALVACQNKHAIRAVLKPCQQVVNGYAAGTGHLDGFQAFRHLVSHAGRQFSCLKGGPAAAERRNGRGEGRLPRNLPDPINGLLNV